MGNLEIITQGERCIWTYQVKDIYHEKCKTCDGRKTDCDGYTPIRYIPMENIKRFDVRK